MGIPVKVEMYGVSADMKATGQQKQDRTRPDGFRAVHPGPGPDLPGDAHRLAVRFSPAGLLRRVPAGNQGFHIWKGSIAHFQSDRKVNFAEVQQIIESPPQAAAPRVRSASEINTSGPQISLQGVEG